MAHPKLWGTTDTRNGLPTTTRESPDFSHGECQNKENISKIEHAINFLDEVEYYDWSDDTITETELARGIQDCINELYDILEKAKKHERELYCEHNNINCSTCKHNGNQWREWVCEMCNSEIQYGHWERN